MSKRLNEKSRVAPAYWEDARFNNPSQPVVGITWCEANAYCAWLSEITGEKYRLPSEAEWEASARGSPYAAKPAFTLGAILGIKTKPTALKGVSKKLRRSEPIPAAGNVGPFETEDQSWKYLELDLQPFTWLTPMSLNKTKKTSQSEARSARGFLGKS